MFVGGCAGSTGGGMKVMRIMLLVKHSYKELFRLIHPRSVNRVKMGKTVVQDDVISGVWGFFILWIGLFVLAAFVVAGPAWMLLHPLPRLWPVSVHRPWNWRRRSDRQLCMAA